MRRIERKQIKRHNAHSDRLRRARAKRKYQKEKVRDRSRDVIVHGLAGEVAVPSVALARSRASTDGCCETRAAASARKYTPRLTANVLLVPVSFCVQLLRSSSARAHCQLLCAWDHVLLHSKSRSTILGLGLSASARTDRLIEAQLLDVGARRQQRFETSRANCDAVDSAFTVALFSFAVPTRHGRQRKREKHFFVSECRFSPSQSAKRAGAGVKRPQNLLRRRLGTIRRPPPE